MAPPVALETPHAGSIQPKTQDGPAPKQAGDQLFNPAKHLSFSPPSKTLQMSDLALSPTALSSVATTEPFPLLSHDSVLAHRREIFSPDVLDNCMHHTRPGSVQIRGMAPRYAPFIHQFWHSPEVLKIISDVAGVELVPAMDYEISHANVQLGAGGLEEVRGTPKKTVREAVTTDQTKPIIEWHKDSHPFVCVVMLSDARHMAGGETELMKGDGGTLKVKAPQMGCAVLLQGRYITHTAAPVTNMPERVTIVTSFRPKNPTLLDETTNANVRNKAHLSELYYQWTTYRLDVLAERARITAEALRRRYEDNVKQSDPEGKKGLCRIETVDISAMQKWADEQIAYIQQTMYEMRPLGQ
ncbi:hypothetical protein ASPSYDRAFT_194161 [Aspergillus sydowii CBS 593.65]|uniref:Fe2OG dioxygenase domain-containing protein n=1 Tax=Aspergillus sydowii CBS 593.65 TaxID=1036612 RepID=A0A1L9U0F6_9EURO|nr:uncharacterized protein ASPSYDRAFT_194161 [Aspergillus sydowii CBS 593.65]OJJ65174.1 hypothetical protein ASPSYDRAFT_194161 [Aspergillus sydowii CBS 593.65]